MKQYHVEAAPERGGYILGSDVYASLGDIVARNEHAFRFPISYASRNSGGGSVIVDTEDINNVSMMEARMSF